MEWICRVPHLIVLTLKISITWLSNGSGSKADMAKRVKPCDDGKADFYLHFKRFFRVSKYFFCTVFELDEQKNLKVDCVYFVLFILFRLYQVYLRYLGLLMAYHATTIDNPYSVIRIIHKMADNFSNTTILFEMMRKICHVKKVFKQLKIVDDKIRMSKKTEQDFSKKVFSYFLTAIGLPFLLTILNLAWEAIPLANITFVFLIYFSVTIYLYQAITALFMQLMTVLCTYYIRYIRRELRRIVPPPVSTEICTIDGLSPQQDNMKNGERIKHLRHLLGEVDSLKDETTTAFESILCCNVVILCIEAIYIIFTFLTIFRYIDNYSHLQLIKSIILVNLGISLRALQFVRLVKNCTTLAEEGREMSVLVLEMLAEDVDDSVKKELTIFSAVLIHRQNEVVLYGLFTVDNSLFASIFSGIAMGLVVLLQFNFTDGDGKYDPIKSIQES